jgi:putative membrane protein
VDEAQDATRRTHLANERTQLAWWRTGLTALAVSLAVGRVVPDLGNASSQWPYTAIGVVFALYGLALIAYGTARSRAVDTALARGEYPPAQGPVLLALATVGIVLSLATAVVIVLD